MYCFFLVEFVTSVTIEAKIKDKTAHGRNRSKFQSQKSIGRSCQLTSLHFFVVLFFFAERVQRIMVPTFVELTFLHYVISHVVVKNLGQSVFI